MSDRIIRKTLLPQGWQRVTRSASGWMEVHTGELDGVAGVTHILEVTSPLRVVNLEQSLVVADTGYYWLRFGPARTHWWLTAAFNEKKRLVQYYFDVTRENFIHGVDSSFEDLMLDVVMMPGGQCVLKDQEELEAALVQGHITREEYELACREAEALLTALPDREPELRIFCEKLLGALIRSMEVSI